MLHRRFLTGELGYWSVQDILRPLAASLTIVVTFRFLPTAPTGHLALLAYLATVFVLSLLAAALAANDVRRELWQHGNRLWRLIWTSAF
jgi:hypothetical protein